MMLGIIGAGLSAVGSGLGAYGKARGAGGSIGALNRQIDEQKQLQAQSDAEMMQQLGKTQVGTGGGLASYRASQMMGSGDPSNLFAQNADNDRLANLSDLGASTAMANRNRAQLAEQNDRLRSLYDAEVDKAGTKGIAARTIGQGLRKAGVGMMKAQMMGAGSTTKQPKLEGDYQVAPSKTTDPDASLLS